MAKKRARYDRPSYVTPRRAIPLAHVEILHLDIGEVAVVANGAIRYRAESEVEAKAWAWDHRHEL